MENNKMKDFFFEYIYYRMTKFYFKWDGRIGLTAILGISMIQILLISDFLAAIFRIFFKKNGPFNLPRETPYIGVGIFLFISFLNYLKYRKKYSSLLNKYKNEPYSLRFWKGVFIIVLLAGPWIPFLLLPTL